MKAIIAIIRPEKLIDVRTKLNSRGVQMMTILDVRGCGHQKGFTQEYRGVVEEITVHRKVMLFIAVNEDYVETTVNAIQKSALTKRRGTVGDGKIFVLPLEDCLRISSGESGPIAIGGAIKRAKAK